MEKQTLKKIITIFILVIAVISAITLVSIQMNKPKGTTLSEREELLRENRDCKRMNIATELQLDNYVLCGIYDENKSGIAIFESSGNGYKLQRTTLREQSRVITASEYLNEEWYQLVWFHGAETETAEIVIINTDNNEVIMEHSYDVSDGNIIAFIEPDGLKNFSLDVVYYDAEGNTYEE